MNFVVYWLSGLMGCLYSFAYPSSLSHFLSLHTETGELQQRLLGQLPTSYIQYFFPTLKQNTCFQLGAMLTRMKGTSQLLWQLSTPNEMELKYYMRLPGSLFKKEDTPAAILDQGDGCQALRQQRRKTEGTWVSNNLRAAMPVLGYLLPYFIYTERNKCLFCLIH